MNEIEEFLERIARGEDTCAGDIKIPTEPVESEYEPPERYKTCGRCKHNEEGHDIVGSICYLCRRNPDDHRIDWFEYAEGVCNE